MNLKKRKIHIDQTRTEVGSLTQRDRSDVAYRCARMVCFQNTTHSTYRQGTIFRSEFWNYACKQTHEETWRRHWSTGFPDVVKMVCEVELRRSMKRERSNER